MATENTEFRKVLRERAMILLRVLPGAAVLWSDFFNEELVQENNFERNLACPALYRRPSGSLEVFWTSM